MTLDITSNAMIVNVHLGVWTGFKLDKGAGQDVATNASADDVNAFNVNKRLVSKEALKPVEAARNAIRTRFLDRTLPWDDNGDRILVRKLFTKYIDEHSPLEQKFTDLADEFAHKLYKSEVEKAAFRLGARFNASEYPSSAEVRSRFYCRMDIKPVPTAGDFRVNLTEETVDNIRTQIEDATTARIFAAQTEVWQRIEKTVHHFAGRMAAQMEEPEDGKRRAPLHQSTIDNLIHLVNALPALNLMGDPNMKQVGRKLHGLLQSYSDTDMLKGNAKLCAEAHDEVQDIISEMNTFVRAFAGEV